MRALPILLRSMKGDGLVILSDVRIQSIPR